MDRYSVQNHGLSWCPIGFLLSADDDGTSYGDDSNDAVPTFSVSPDICVLSRSVSLSFADSPIFVRETSISL